MKTALKNKQRLALIGVVSLCVVAGLAILYSHQQTNKSQEERIVATNFSITKPEGITEDTSSRGNIYLTFAKPYGDITVYIHQSSVVYTTVSQKGKITKSTVTVDGVSTEKQEINYATIIRGQSTKPLIRYEVQLKNIPKPSADNYTEFHLTVLSKTDITSANIADANALTDSLLQSLKIK